VSINFNAPSSGGPPYYYVVDYRVTGQSVWQYYGTVSQPGWNNLIGLTPDTSYDVQVCAVNTLGSGPPSATFAYSTLAASTEAQGITPPGQIPWIGAGDASTTTSISVNFAAPTSGGPVADYVLDYRVTGQNPWTTYGTVTWAAENADGVGLPSATFTVPTAPVSAAPAVAPNQVLSIGQGGAPTPTTVSISFAAPYGGGTPTGYVIQYRVTGSSAWTTYGSVTGVGWQTLAGLAPGTSYDVQVYATNAYGNGPPSSIFTISTIASSAGQSSPPGAIPWIGAGGASTPTTISFSFSAPITGGSVADYVIQYRVTGQSAWSTYGTVTWIGWQTITGLSQSTSYDVQVYATNLAGSSPVSATFTTATTSN
jgi:titin